MCKDDAAPEVLYDEARGLLFVFVSGPATPTTLIGLLDVIESSPTWPPDTAAVWDLREADFSAARTDDLRTVLAEHATREARVRARIAMIADDDLKFGMLRMYELMGGDRLGAVRIFREREAAERWALGDDDV